ELHGLLEIAPVLEVDRLVEAVLVVHLLDQLRCRPLAEERLGGTPRQRPDPDEDEDRQPEQDRDEQQESANDEPEHLVPSACRKAPFVGPGGPGPTRATDWTSRSTRSRSTECRPGSARSRARSCRTPAPGSCGRTGRPAGSSSACCSPACRARCAWT